MSSAFLPKPKMRGLMASRLKIQLALAILVSVGSAGVYKFAVADPRKRAYAEFYKNFDFNKTYEAMRETGIFESAPPKGS